MRTETMLFFKTEKHCPMTLSAKCFDDDVSNLFDLKKHTHPLACSWPCLVFASHCPMFKQLGVCRSVVPCRPSFPLEKSHCVA